MAAGSTKWRTRWRLGAVLFAILLQVVNGYEQLYTISQLSPKSASIHSPRDLVLETSHAENLDISILPSIEQTLESKHTIVERSADPDFRESRSINIEEIPANNEIDNELELHNKRKYYDLHPTKTVDYLRESDDEIVLSSEGYGDKLNFRFPGEGNRVPRARLLPPSGPKIRPTAAQPIFATATYRDEGRQNTEIQNIITGLVKLLNGNVNVQANSQLLNGRPARPLASRINNRGPPRISDAPPIPDFDKPLNLPTHIFYPTKAPPPYPFDLPPHHGVNLPEQIVPPLTPPRPGLHRPMPPWPRPRPWPPSHRPKPGLPIYMPTPQPAPIDIPELDDIIKDIMSKPEKEQPVSENETNHSENNIHHEEEKEMIITNLPEVNTTEEFEENFTTIVDITTSSTTTSTTETTTTTEKTTTTERPTTTEKTEKLTTATTEETEKAKPSERTTTEKTTTEKMKIDKTKLDKDKKKDTSYSEKEKPKDKIKIGEDKTEKTNSPPTLILESSFKDDIMTSFYQTPTPTEVLTQTTSIEASTVEIIETSSINTLPITTSTDMLHHPYRPRPGIVLDDTDFKPHGTRVRSEASIITAAETGLPWYGEIFNVTVSAIQGPGGKGGSVHIETVNPISGHEHDDIIVSPSGAEGFVSIDGKRTYLDIFGSSTDAGARVDVRPTQIPQHTALPPPSPSLGTGVAIPADDITQTPVKRPHPLHRPAPTRPPARSPTVRIDTCILGDDSTCDTAQNEMCRTESGISSCQCRPGYAKRIHREPCRRVVSLLLNMRVDRLDHRKIVWDQKLADKESDPYQQLSYEAIRAIDSAFSMTPFSDDFVSGLVNAIHEGDQNHQGVFVNYTILMHETAETVRPSVATDIQKHLLGVIKRRSNNIGTSILWVDSPVGSVLPLKDFDECASADFNDCHQLATCSNTWGGFRCACPASHRDAGTGARAGRTCEACAATHCNDRGLCQYKDNQPYCSCSSGYYGSTCEVDGEVVGVAVGASLAAALVIALTLAALMSWSRKWSREQKAAGMGSPVFNYMAANTIKTPPVGQPPYQVTLEERMRWAQIAEAMAQSNHYGEPAHTMTTRPSSALFGYPTLPPVPLPRLGLHHTGTLNTLASRVNTTAPSHHNLYGYTNHMASESSSEASSHVQERADLLVPRPKSRARSMHNQTGIYCDVDYENTPDNIYGSKGIPLSTYTVSRGPPFYRT